MYMLSHRVAALALCLAAIAATCEAQTSDAVCSANGQTCSLCMKQPGCQWCDVGATCFARGQGKCNKQDLRTNDRNSNGGTPSSDSCDFKCTSRTCFVPHSSCSMVKSKSGTYQPQCLCDKPYVAQGTTLCALPRKGRQVASMCTNGDPDPGACSLRVLRGERGCASGNGYDDMRSKCRAACGAFCQKNNCKSKNGAVDYADYYCTPTRANDCFDTSALDYACPHHNLGQIIPDKCNDLTSNSDDTCGNVFTAWYNRCKSTVARVLPVATQTKLAA
eukprot:COSAG05_NODE_5804_length_1084_cov_1.406091_1_plen_275_part_10